MTPALLLTGVIVTLAALLVLVLFVLFPAPPRISKSRRSAPGEEPDSALSRFADQAVSAVETATRGRDDSMRRYRLEQAGIKLEPSAFLLLTISAAVVLAAFGFVLGFGSIWGVVLAIVFGALAFLGAKILVSIRTSRRRAKFETQLDDTLQLLAGGLRAGHSLLRAIDSVARDADAPTSEEFARVVNETRLGRDLGEALAVTAERMQSDDFSWVAQAIAINREAGGNLSEVLDQVGNTIRERNQIRRQVSALSAEGKLSAIVLIVLPIGVFLFLLWVQPGYFVPMFTTLIGWIALFIAAVLLVVGTIWMYFTVKVKF
ncbi:type II secretion system F family protein [Agromyces sp. C10]|uniref:type II secretion system F family protein n=1 Tax=Agromyces sp. C10 TaxID=2935077 RepID=UPI002009DF99|nr:type II secretion system F family protein [Agromyces sp. C10]MCK8608339.1 type II secretion system F family protein [Agromyces sp. C10]